MFDVRFMKGAAAEGGAGCDSQGGEPRQLPTVQRRPSLPRSHAHLSFGQDSEEGLTHRFQPHLKITALPSSKAAREGLVVFTRTLWHLVGLILGRVSPNLKIWPRGIRDPAGV